MKLLELLKDENIIITPYDYKKSLLLELSHDNNLYNIKFFTWEEFRNNYYFSTNLDTLDYIVKNNKVSLELANKYLDNLYYLKNKNYDNHKLKFLVTLKEKLVTNNLLITNPTFKNKIKNHNIIILGYDTLDSFYINDLKNDFSNIEIINSPKNNNIQDYYYFNHINDEVSFVAEEIIKLLKNDVQIDNIYLNNLNEEYKIIIDRIFKMYNIPVILNKTSSLMTTNVAKECLSLIKEKLSNEELINRLTKKYENSNNLLKIIQVLNKYITTKSDLNYYYEYIRDDFKKTMTVNNDNYQGVRELKTLISLNEDQHIFVLGFNNEFPRYYKDEDYILDFEKLEIGNDNTSIKNTKEKNMYLNYLTSSKNIIITFAKATNFSKYEESSLVTSGCFNKKEITKTIYFDNSYYRYLLAEKLDRLISFNEKNHLIEETYHQFKLPYLTYSNIFTGLSEKKLRQYLKHELTLSYSSINDYYDNPFIYYLKHILKIVPYEERFTAILGTVYHDVLKEAFTSSFDFDLVYEKATGKYDLSSKEKFYLKNLKEELRLIIFIIIKQNMRSKFNAFLYEKRIEIKYQTDYDLIFKGFIDKIALYKTESKTFVSLIDYKTGNTEIDLKYLKYGLNMQLPIYSYLINKSKLFDNQQVIGFYLQRILNNKKVFKKGENLLKQKEQDLKLIGYTIDDLELMKIIDNKVEEDSYIKNLRFTKTGLYRYAKVLDENYINQLTTNVEEKIISAANNIMKGEFPIAPKFINNLPYGFNYKEYKDICFYTAKDYIYLNFDEEEIDEKLD